MEETHTHKNTPQGGLGDTLKPCNSLKSSELGLGPGQNGLRLLSINRCFFILAEIFGSMTVRFFLKLLLS